MASTWARFRAWPWWAQGIVWLFWPLPLAALAASRPPERRRRWWAACAAGSVVWIAAVAARPRAPTSNVTSSVATAVDRTTTTERQVSISTSTSTASSSSTTTTTAGTPGTREVGAADPFHPDPRITPGAVIPGVSAVQVCVSGYTATVRDVPQTLKDRVYAAYGISDPAPRAYEIDHLVALELGGSNDFANLWPEPASGADNSHDKDIVENRLHALVCQGAVSLVDAQTAIVHWDTWVEPSATAPTSAVAVESTSAPPVTTAPSGPANGATALCKDGSYSFAAHHQGACSHHGGVAEFYR